MIPAPENVRIKWSDGTEEAVDCTYEGRSPDGEHLWTVVNRSPIQIERYPVGLLIDALPPGASVALTVNEWFRALPAPFTCPRCGAVSHHPEDLRQGYCGRCRDFTVN